VRPVDVKFEGVKKTRGKHPGTKKMHSILPRVLDKKRDYLIKMFPEAGNF
jgi:hypothetical protein